MGICIRSESIGEERRIYYNGKEVVPMDGLRFFFGATVGLTEEDLYGKIFTKKAAVQTTWYAAIAAAVVLTVVLVISKRDPAKPNSLKAGQSAQISAGYDDPNGLKIVWATVGD